jgi:hypothetical protein
MHLHALHQQFCDKGARQRDGADHQRNRHHLHECRDEGDERELTSEMLAKPATSESSIGTQCYVRSWRTMSPSVRKAESHKIPALSARGSSAKTIANSADWANFGAAFRTNPDEFR